MLGRERGERVGHGVAAMRCDDRPALRGVTLGERETDALEQLAWDQRRAGAAGS